MAAETNRRVSTSTLLSRLFRTTSLERFVTNNSASLSTPSFCEHIDALCVERGVSHESVIKKANIERAYGHQIFRGIRKPSRDKVIQLAFAFGLNVDGANHLLKLADKSELYPRIKRDAAILYCIKHSASLDEAQQMLDKLSLTLLGGENDGR